MYKKWFVIIILLIALTFIEWRLYTMPDKPEIPTVTYHNQEVQVVQGSYRWKNINVDLPHPPILLENVQPTIIIPSIAEPEGNLKVNFLYQPKWVKVKIWKQGVLTPHNIDHKTIIVPKEHGVYIFEIIGTWVQGESSYAFVVEVR